MTENLTREQEYQLALCELAEKLPIEILIRSGLSHASFLAIRLALESPMCSGVNETTEFQEQVEKSFSVRPKAPPPPPKR